MKILIEFIPHKEQRYNTVGDYYWEGDDFLIVKISDTGSIFKNFCILIHELWEFILAVWHGVTIKEIDDFDLRWPADDDREPGDHPACPVYREHQRAMVAERLLATDLEIDWNIYNEEVDEVSETWQS